MIETIESLDKQIHDAAQPLDRAAAELARQSIEDTELGGGFLTRLTNSYDHCANRRALARMKALPPPGSAAQAEAMDFLTGFGG